MAKETDDIPLADGDGAEEILDVDILRKGATSITTIATKFGPLERHNSDNTAMGLRKVRGIKMAAPLPRFLINRNGALISPDDIQDAEERATLIAHVLELQNTLEDLSLRVDCVRGDSDKLRGENALLAQYIQKLMSASPSFKAVQVKEGQKQKAKSDLTVNAAQK